MTVPAPIVWSSHKRRIAVEGGVQGRGVNSSAYFADMHDINLIGLVAPQHRPGEVADLSWIDDAHDRGWQGSVTRSKKLELENALMKPLTVAIIGALVVAVAVFGYLYYQRTRNDITIQTPKVELKN
jgi:hypothetical protein